MFLIGWAIVGLILGAAGSEILRAKKPRLVDKVEGAAKRFVDSISPDETDSQKPKADERQGGDDALI